MQKQNDNKLRPSEFEDKWQKTWRQMRTYQPDLNPSTTLTTKKPYYNLMMFPYPSAEGLHVGNMYAFTGADINGRFQRMRGLDVFEPIGLDGFGIHSENYAIKVGRHPREQARISEEHFYRQLSCIGNGFAWENRLETYDPQYYKWTQWIFIQMFKHGLAYRKKSPVNFCPSCKTVLSDEQVLTKPKSDQLVQLDQSVCERCGTPVEKREMEQWFFKITKYAERLLQNTYKKDFQWTEKVKIGQRNWIGKKEGINITYPVVDEKGSPIVIPTAVEGSSNFKDGRHAFVTVFTTAPVNFGMTFLVLSAEHELTKKIIEGKIKVSKKIQDEVETYVNVTKKKSEMERISEGREKTGVFSGLYAINQINNTIVPIYVTDFVLSHVGTGAVQGCPGHDLKDFQFAKKFGLPIIRVVVGVDGDKSAINREDQVIEKGTKGTFVNSEFLNGLSFDDGLQKTMDYFEQKGWGKRVTTYKLRDWCISRQRYWGAPIPMVYCPSCAIKSIGWISLNRHPERSEGSLANASSDKLRDSSTSLGMTNTDSMPGWYPVPEDQLPVLLPDLKDWKPEGTGKGPLAKLPEFVKTTCPKCGGKADRETDVCDTFLDSAWYFLRYPSHHAGPAARASQTSLQHVHFVHAASPGASFGNPSLASPAGLPWDPQITKKWLPVTQYIGGAEHTVLHLLYARFVTMVFKDLGFVEFEEPFSRFYAHGLIISEGAKMSKSRGNVIIPDEYINKYGADTLRTYLMFLGPFDMGGDFRDTGIAGMYRFLNRVWRLVTTVIPIPVKSGEESLANASSNKLRDPSTYAQDDSLMRVMHRTIKKVTEDLENFRYNTAIAHIMEFMNELHELEIRNLKLEIIEALLLLIAPFAPFMAEELWQRLHESAQDTSGVTRRGSPDGGGISNKFHSIHLHPWPSFNPNYLIEETLTIPVQVNGKLRDTVTIQNPKSKIQKEVEQEAKRSEKVKKYINGKKVQKVIFVPGKLINFVV